MFLLTLSLLFSFWITHTTNSVDPTVVWEGRGVTGFFTGPYFDSTNQPNVTAQLGTHAFLHCKVKQLGNKSVSWIRRRDSHILTVDRYTFISDERFQLIQKSDSWTLQIKYIQRRDQGQYECQVTTEPKMSLFVNMDVIVPETKILGESDLFVKRGSTVQIKCMILQSMEQPSFIFWYHEGENILNLNGKHHWVERVNPDTTVGTLVIEMAERTDGGNITCAPSYLESASVTLHVINGKYFIINTEKKCLPLFPKPEHAP